MTATSRFSPDQQRQLALLAWQALSHGLCDGPPPAVGGAAWLQEPAATFVTLTLHGELRGCIGNLRPTSGLGASVARNAEHAAFADPRFGPLQRHELPALRVEISVLTPMVALQVPDRAALLQALRPGVDGLWVQAAGRAATYLPAVWDDVPQAAAFVDSLWRKAGLPLLAWPPDIALWTYQADKFAAPDSGR